MMFWDLKFLERGIDWGAPMYQKNAISVESEKRENYQHPKNKNKKIY